MNFSNVIFMSKLVEKTIQHNILWQMFQKLWGDMCRRRPFDFSLIKIFPQPLSHLTFFGNHAHPNQLKSASYIFSLMKLKLGILVGLN